MRTRELARLLGDYFKSREIFSQMRVTSRFLIVRCDGRNFSGLAKQLRLQKLDERFHSAMVSAVERVMKESGFSIALAYTASDEVSFLLLQPPFSGRVEKIDSVFSGLMSSALTLELSEQFGFRGVISFDARVVALNTVDELSDYFLWRVLETFRNFLNACAQDALLRQGLSPREVAERLHGVRGRELVSLIERELGPIDKFPEWARFGTWLVWDLVERVGFNPVRGAPVRYTRRVLRRIHLPPDREKIRALIERSLRCALA